MNEQDSTTTTNNPQIPRNRIIGAAVLVAQGALLLRQASTARLSGRDAGYLRTISEGLQQLVPALQRLGRANAPDGHFDDLSQDRPETEAEVRLRKCKGLDE